MSNSDFSQNIDDSLKSLGQKISDSASEIKNVELEENSLRNEMRELASRVEELSKALGIDVKIPEIEDLKLLELNQQIDSIVAPDIKDKSMSLSGIDCTVAALAGVLSVAIDVIFVGTPEVVKLYRGGENFDGSKLTAIIRGKINVQNDGKIGEILTWLSEKCTVPYDTSCIKGVVNPNNHRLRCLAHDPYFGLFFAIADILLGTTTCIDDNGHIKIIKTIDADPVKKIFPVIYYLGHIVSDLFTARGIPIPGFFLTQFFTQENEMGDSIATIAESMYKDGYDMRHLASMSVPVAVKNMVIDLYSKMQAKERSGFIPLAEGEVEEIRACIRKEKMLFISDSIGAVGNAVKLLAPPSCGNPCSLNAVQWYEFIKNGIEMMRIANRDDSGEQIIEIRKVINEKWVELEYEESK